MCPQNQKSILGCPHTGQKPKHKQLNRFKSRLQNFTKFEQIEIHFHLIFELAISCLKPKTGNKKAKKQHGKLII